MDTTSVNIPTPTNPPVKPVLKHPGETALSSSAAAAAADEAAKRDEKKHLTWDEHAIEEHDLLRGTRMKIDEPNTPYTHYDQSDDEQSTSSGRHPRSPDEKNSPHVPPLAWNALETKLQAVANKRDACSVSPAPSRDGASDSEGEEAARRMKMKQEEHEREFKDHRKKHYNEAEALKRWRMEHMENDEDEEENENYDGGVKDMKE